MPVGPEFQDPPQDVNQQPYFVPPLAQDGPPFYETTVTLSGMRQFVAIVGDANLDDSLTVRWVANYPPVSMATRLIVDDPVERDVGTATGSSKQTVTCDDFMMGNGDHNLVVIVSDKGFLKPDTFAQNPLTFQNQIPYNFNSQSDLVATMTGWRIAGCTQ